MMKIKIRLFATLREGRGKELIKEYDVPTTPKDIITELGIAESDVAILLINGRDGNLEQVLKMDDVVSIFPPVGGG